MPKRRSFNKKPRSWFRYLVSLGLVLSLISFFLRGVGPSTSSVSPQPPATLTEIRGVWLTNVASGVLFAPWGIKRAMQQLSQQNFNTVYPVAWNRGHTFYPSEVAKRFTGEFQEPLITFLYLGQDVLAEILQQGHEQGLRIIPWFEYGFMAPKDSQLAKQHPDWISRSQQETNNPQVWLNPLHPGVQQFLLELILEVVRRYDVDGIQLDDHFGMPIELGYDAFTVQLYQQEHAGQSPPDDPENPEWMIWRANKITDFMETIFEEIKLVKPDCLVSLSPNYQEFAYKHYLQDWLTWVERGLVEELVLQVYRDDLDSFQAQLSQTAIKLASRLIPVAVGILTGTPKQPVSIKQIEQQVQLVRDNSLDGVSFFYWESLWSYLTPESPQQRRKAFRRFLSSPTSVSN
ncbi:MAG: glycoside hydrolase family 10 protein [Coleofasciculaceae cyanobacterium]